MARKTYSLHVTADGTVRVMVGRQREYIGITSKTKAELFDAVKYALISKDAYVSDVRLTEDLYEIGVF